VVPSSVTPRAFGLRIGRRIIGESRQRHAEQGHTAQQQRL
jgi:hypothetical protein